MRKQSKPSFTRLLSDLQSTVREASRRVKSAKMVKSALQSDLAIANKLAGSLRCFAWVNGLSDLRVRYVVALEVDNFKDDARLLALLERVLDAGLVAKPSDDYVTKNYAERSYEFALPNGGSFKVGAELRAEGETCKRVLTGTKMVREETYELVCS